MKSITTRACTKAEAKALTESIRKGVDHLWALLLEAHERKAWKVLGYETWGAYVKAEFGMSRQHSYHLLDQGKVIREVEEAAGARVSERRQITKEVARDIKGELPAVTEEIRSRVHAGEQPETAVAEVIEDSRRVKAEQKAEREARQAENDRQRNSMRSQLPDSIKRTEEAKAKNGSAHAAVTHGLTPEERIAELKEAVAALTADNARLADENKRFGEMKALFAKGGFEAVVAAKDEEIRVLKSRVETESGDKAGWAKKAKFWKNEAVKLGYSSDLIIPLDDDQEAMRG